MSDTIEPVAVIFVMMNTIMLGLVYLRLAKFYGKANASLFVVIAMIMGIAGESLYLYSGAYAYGDVYSFPFADTTVPLGIAIAWAWVLGLAMIVADYYTKGKENGTGLGLFVSDQIIKLHRGTITADSTLGKGTTFTIRIPLPKK